jgi:EpsD family peptidyl-prolyl cis-trans isomerase
MTVSHATLSSTQRHGRGFAALLTAVVLGLLVAGCGEKKKDKAATQAAARVNSQEITVHQINLVLEQQRGLPPAQAASASRMVLDRLVDQELALQEAQNQKLDRDPRVVRHIEAAKREIIARAYTERVGAAVARPTADDIKKYYSANPALFSERRVYNLQELSIEAKPEQLAAVRASLQSAKDSAGFIESLKAAGFKVSGRQAMTPAEQLPIGRLGAFADMKDGQATFKPVPGGAQVIFVLGSRSLPVDEEKARPAIEQFLLNERRQKAIQDDLAALRAAAKIEYVGEFAADAKTAEVAAAAASTVEKETQSPLIGPSSSSGVTVHLPRGASAPSSAVVENALKGLK